MKSFASSVKKPKGLLAAFILVLFSLAMIVACGDDDTSSPQASPGSQATSTPTPTAVASSGEPVSPRLKITMGAPSIQATMAHPMGQRDSKLMPQYEYLIGQHYQTGEFQPQIATEWTISANGRDFNWKIRRDVPFIRNARSTGETVNAADIILSWEIAASIATQNVLSTVTEFGDKVDATVINDYEIDLHLAKVGLNIPFLMSDEWAWGVVSKDHWDAKGGEAG